MRVPTLETVYLLAIMDGAMASWQLDGYKTGCPVPGKNTPVGGTAGSPGDELWCIGIASAHNIVATGIEADGMVVTLFSDAACEHVIVDFDTDGCKVIPSHTVVEAARVLPK